MLVRSRARSNEIPRKPFVHSSDIDLRRLVPEGRAETDVQAPRPRNTAAPVAGLHSRNIATGQGLPASEEFEDVAGWDESCWWRHAVIYEIAPISFQDTDADGRGDLAGLERRIDYLRWLGVDAVWLTPIQKSPMRDFGYDIADYCAIDPTFGTMEDFDRLLAALHQAGIRLILDLVPNHTSSDHPWFRESSSSRSGQKAAWYLWSDPAANGGPPNNWQSRFGGSAWKWSEARQQFYCHTFLAEQPDLNWRNQEVRQALADVMRFWLDRGVDGFRVDASAVLIKDDLLRDNPPNPDATDKMPPPQRDIPVFTDDRPEAMACIEMLREVVDEYGSRLLCGEVQGKTDRIGHFYGSEKPRLHLPLNFALLDSKWNALSLQATVDAYFNALPKGAWPVWVIGGHDKKRVASRIGQAQARVLAMLLMTIRGTPFFYMGDEIGMERQPVPPDRVQDPFEKLVPGYGLGRDGERTPMRWDDTPGGGFTTGQPWLPLLGDPTRNVTEQRGDEASLLHLYRRLIEIRRKEPALVEGEYQAVRARNDVLCYERRLAERRLLIGLNICDEPRRWEFGTLAMPLLSTYPTHSTEMEDGSVLLRANEGLLLSTSQY
jgi:alpha-glucosidase